MTNLTQKSKQFLKALVPAKVLQARLHRRVFIQFAERIGFVYFGYVDQRSDEHRLVRGLTVSARHRDNHYCIGSYENYDITLVERSDTIHFPGKPSRTHNWIIMTFDLHTSRDVPHVFLGFHSHNETFYAHLFTKFSQLTKIPLGTFGQHSSKFTERYALFTEPAHTITVEQLFHPAVTAVIGDSFGNLTAEVADGCVYIYAEHNRPTVQLLEKMLQCGLWLSQTIDASMIRDPNEELINENNSY
jgi:hypothetical protein